MNSLKRAEEPQFWLLAIGAGLMALQLSLAWRAGNSDILGTSFVFWAAVSSLVWDRRETLKLESSIFSSFLGATIIAVLLLKSLSVSGYDVFIRFAPFISAVGLALLASGVKGLKQYWQELVIFAFVAIPPGLPLRFMDVATLTAKFTGFILWYLGFDVARKGVTLALPTGSVEVASGCTGVSSILQLLGLAVLIVFMFPTNLRQKVILPIVAIIIGFLVNGVRVALMAILVAFSNRGAFEYWHTGGGSFIFSLIGGLIFWCFCRYVVLRDPPKNQEAGES